MRRTVFIILFVTLTSVIFAQSERIRFSAITTQQGLSNNWVRCIYQDNNGFIWAGTADGLNRFDGYRCKVFRPLDEQGRSLGDIHINAFLPKNQHSAWVCTDNGVYVFDFNQQEKLESFILGKSSVLCAQEDTYGNLWFGTSRGLYRYGLTDSLLTQVNLSGFDQETGNSNFVNTVYIDRNLSLWVGTKNGLFFCSKENHYQNGFKRLPATEVLKGKDVMSLCMDSFGRLWIATFQDGLFMLATDRGQKQVCTRFMNGHFTSLMTDTENNLWIGRSSDEGLARIKLDEITHLRKPEVVTYLHSPADPLSISNNSVVCLFLDKHNDTWIGTNEGGMNFFSKREKQFYVVSENDPVHATIQCNLVNTFFEEEQYLWIGTEEGLERWDKNTGEFVHFHHRPDNPNSLGANPVFSIAKDRHGNLWIGTWAGGLNLYNYRTNTFTRMVKSADPRSISNNNVISLLEDRYGYLWVTTQGGGLNRYDPLKKEFMRFMHDENDPGTLYHTSVNDIIETRAGEILVSTYFSVDVFDRETETFRHFIYSDDEGTGGKIVSLFEDSRRNIWLTTNRGLELLDPTAGTFTLYFSDSTQTNNVAQAILEDQHGNLWISTNNGLYKIVKGIDKPSRPEFIRFTKEDGLSGDEFTKRAAFHSKSGMMYFGSSEGFTYFHPDSIVLNTNTPPVVLDEMMVLQEQPDKRVSFQPIRGNVNNLKAVELSYKHADFIITFAALNYLHPEKNQYQYKLEGYDKSWVDAGTERSASYTNIYPGRYTFMIEGSNNDGIWSAEARKISIIIHPPWWRTRFMKIAIPVILLLIVAGIIRIRLSILQHQKKVLQETVNMRTEELQEANTLLEEKQEEILMQNEELLRHRNNLEELVNERTNQLEKAKQKAEESDQLKSSFLANMSHEIRTPMNAILGFSSLLKEREFSEEEKEGFIRTINQNGETLMYLIDDILDISMIESNQMVFKPQYFNVNTMLAELEEFWRLKNEQGLTIEFMNRKDTELILNIDPVRFQQIMNNLISNAMKYTHEGYIRFGYEVNDKNIRFFVADSGVGIDPKYSTSVFDHFFKIEIDSEKVYRGTGIGLSICKRIVEILNGKIWVESKPGSGSTFYFTIPYMDYSEQGAMNNAKRKTATSHSLESFFYVIAEDEPANYQILVKMLRIPEERHYWGKNGKEAVEYIAKQNHHNNILVLMDIKMPVMNGYDALLHIKKISTSIPVIAVTAHALKHEEKEILAKGFDGYLAKPLRVDKLKEVIGKISTTQH